MAQHEAAHFVFCDYLNYSSVSSTLTKLNLQSLEQKNMDAIIIMFYNIITKLISINFSIQKPLVHEAIWTNLSVRLQG